MIQTVPLTVHVVVGFYIGESNHSTIDDIINQIRTSTKSLYVYVFSPRFVNLDMQFHRNINFLILQKLHWPTFIHRFSTKCE